MVEETDTSRNSNHLFITFFFLNGAVIFTYEHCVSKAIKKRNVMSKPQVFVTRIIPGEGLEMVRSAADVDVWP